MNESSPSLTCSPSGEISILPRKISGINIEEGLKRVVGNSELLIRILKQFADKHANDVTKLRVAIEEKNSVEVKQIIHVLTGVTGTICAEQLYERVKLLGDVPDDADLEAVEALLAEVVAGIRNTRAIQAP